MGINSKETRENIFEIISNKSVIGMKEFFTIFKDDSKWISDIINILNSNHIDTIIMKSIVNELKDKNIIDSVVKFDSTVNTRNIQKKIDHFREQKELKKVLDMNLNVKK